MKVTDINGREFEFEIKDIEDMDKNYQGNGMGSLHDSERHSMANFVATVVDSENKEVNVNQLVQDINNGKAKLPNAIDVVFEATHSGDNLNDFIYHSDSMCKDVETWKAPFPKPFIKNHDMHEEPLGRVRDAWFEQSEFNPDRDTINVNFRINDKDAIMKFLDGRYKTMSVGGKMGTVTCSLCGKTLLKDGQFKFCGHWRGEVYNGQKALWNGRDITYKEGSAVNAPADMWAQVKRITIVGDALLPAQPPKPSNGKDSENNNMPNPDVNSIVDNLTGGAGEPPANDPNKATPPAAGTQTDNDPPAETVESLKAKVADLEGQITGLNGTITQKDADIQTLTDNNNELTGKLDLADQEKQTLRDQAVAIAVANKKLMAQRVVDFMLFNKEIKDTEVADKVSEFTLKKATELQVINDGLKINVQADNQPAGTQPNPTNPTNPTSATSPGLVNDKEPNSTIVDGEDPNKETAPKAQQSFKDFEAVVFKALNK